MSNKKTRWYCDTGDAKEMKRLALLLGDVSQEEAFGVAVRALAHQIEGDPKKAKAARKADK